MGLMVDDLLPLGLVRRQWLLPTAQALGLIKLLSRDLELNVRPLGCLEWEWLSSQ